jgi:hypothetical protein
VDQSRPTSVNWGRRVGQLRKLAIVRRSRISFASEVFSGSGIPYVLMRARCRTGPGRHRMSFAIDASCGAQGKPPTPKSEFSRWRSANVSKAAPASIGPHSSIHPGRARVFHILLSVPFVAIAAAQGNGFSGPLRRPFLPSVLASFPGKPVGALLCA